VLVGSKQTVGTAVRYTGSIVVKSSGGRRLMELPLTRIKRDNGEDEDEFEDEDEDLFEDEDEEEDTRRSG